jgi:hypothetical protein
MKKTMRNGIPWIDAERFERSKVFELRASPERIFPLLCPVLEYEWLPGWRCQMAYSRTGVAERDAVFFTREAPGKKATWTTIAYEPPRSIEYLIALGADAVVRLEIGLEPKGAGTTAVTWTMRFTACSAMGKAVVRRRYSEEKFAEMIEARERELSSYLRNKAG